MTLADSEATAALIVRAELGDGNAVNTLLEFHRDYLRRVVDARLEPSLRNRLDPSDVVQEALATASTRLDEFIANRPTSFRLWLRGKALDRLVDQRRFHRSKKRDVANERSLSDASSMAILRGTSQRAVTSGIEQRELIAQVHQAIETLSEMDREVLILRHAEELTNAEAAEVMRIEAKAASARYGRAILRLSAELRRQGVCGDPSR